MSIGDPRSRPATLALGEAERALVEFLQTLAAMERRADRPATAEWAHRSVYELVLAHGRWFTPAALPPHIHALPERQCFANAFATEKANQGYIYTEGFAVGAGCSVAVHHAWCTTPGDQAVDPTWAKLGGAAYLGIPLADPALRPDPRLGNGVLERPETLYPLLRDGLQPGGDPTDAAGLRQ